MQRRMFLGLFGWGVAACSGGKAQPPAHSGTTASTNGPLPDASPAASSSAAAPPRSPAGEVKLVETATFTCGAAHPTEPWFATGSMSHLEPEWTGQVVLWDVRTGSPLWAASDEWGFGFEPDEGMLAWDPTGRRLAAANGTNAIVAIEDGRLLMQAFPDETRDHPVRFVWGSQSELLIDAFDDTAGQGSILAVQGNSGRTIPLPKGVPPSAMRYPRFNRTLGAVVGATYDLTRIVAIDLSRKAIVYDVSLAAALPKPNGRSLVAWSPDGRRFAAVDQPPRRGLPSTLTVFDGDHGASLAKLTIDGEIDSMVWGGSGDRARLALVAGASSMSPERVVVIADGREAWSVKMPVTRSSFDMPDTRAVAWEPSGERCAIVSQDGSTRLFSADKGTPGATLRTDLPKRCGLLWTHGDRLVGLDETTLAVFDLDGKVIARRSLPKKPPAKR